MDRRELESAVNDKARKIRVRGPQAIVPLKFDKHGNPSTDKTRIYKRLSISDLRFLQIWRDAGWDVQVAIQKAALPQPVAERLIKRLQCFREEDARVKALCEIPTPAWIAAKHVENVYEGGRLEDSEHKSLQELAKIQGAYKSQTNVNITQNVFNLPKLTPEAEAKIKAIADLEADVQEAQVVNE